MPAHLVWQMNIAGGHMPVGWGNMVRPGREVCCREYAYIYCLLNGTVT
jgi:hypothetical protein